jgi:hypothetical protein
MAEPVEEIEAEAEAGTDESCEIVEEPSAATVIAEPVEPSRPKPVEGAEKPAQPRRRSRARRRRR